MTGRGNGGPPLAPKANATWSIPIHYLSASQDFQRGFKGINHLINQEFVFELLRKLQELLRQGKSLHFDSQDFQFLLALHKEDKSAHGYIGLWK